MGAARKSMAMPGSSPVNVSWSVSAVLLSCVFLRARIELFRSLGFRVLFGVTVFPGAVRKGSLELLKSVH